MNRDRSRFTLLAVAGAYLAYTGGVLIKETVSEQPGNMWLFVVIGIAFIGIGAFVLYKNGKAIFQLRREEAKLAEESVVIEESTEVEENTGIEESVEIQESVDIQENKNVEE